MSTTTNKETQEALLKSIKATVEAVDMADLTIGGKVSLLARLSAAYRAVDGGPQPQVAVDGESK